MIDIELEKSIIGSMVSDQDNLSNGMARIKKEHFSDRFHQEAFELVRKMYEDGKHVEPVTVGQEGKGLFGKSGISWLLANYISPGAFDGLTDKLIKCYQLRKLHGTAISIANAIKAGEEPEEVIKLIETDIYSVVSESKMEVVTPKEHAQRMMNTLISRMEKKSNGGIMTTYGDLNRALNGGFEKGQLIIVAAKTGKGKTAFAMNLMRDISVVQKIPGLYINTEMSEDQEDIRMMTLVSEVDHYKIASGTLNSNEKNIVMKNLDKINTSQFYSITEPALTMNKLMSICRRFTAQKKCRFIVVDYIGRMDTMDAKLQEHQVLKNAAKKLKTIAQETKTTILMLAQVNDDEKLEGARGMKNEADMYGYLRELSDEEQSKFGCNYALCVEKNRSGPTRKIPLTFKGDTLTFRGKNHEQLT